MQLTLPLNQVSVLSFVLGWNGDCNIDNTTTGSTSKDDNDCCNSHSIALIYTVHLYRTTRVRRIRIVGDVKYDKYSKIGSRSQLLPEDVKHLPRSDLCLFRNIQT